MFDWQLPSREAWQLEIDKLGFALLLDSAFTLEGIAGFEPVAYNREETGFELYVSSAEAITADFPHIESRIGKRDACVTFRWGGDPLESAAAISAAAALTELTDGIWYDPQDDRLLGSPAVVTSARRDLRSIEEL